MASVPLRCEHNLLTESRERSDENVSQRLYRIILFAELWCEHRLKTHSYIAPIHIYNIQRLDQNLMSVVVRCIEP